MKPTEVPDDLLDAAKEAWDRHAATAPPGTYTHEGIRRAILAAVLPAYTERVLTAAADQLDAMPETDGASLKGPYWYRDGWKQAAGMLRDWADYPPALAARIARGES